MLHHHFFFGNLASVFIRITLFHGCFEAVRYDIVDIGGDSPFDDGAELLAGVDGERLVVNLFTEELDEIIGGVLELALDDAAQVVGVFQLAGGA